MSFSFCLLAFVSLATAERPQCPTGQDVNIAGACADPLSLRVALSGLTPNSENSKWVLDSENAVKFKYRCYDEETCPQKLYVYFAGNSGSTATRCKHMSDVEAYEVLGEVEVTPAAVSGTAMIAAEVTGRPTLRTYCNAVLVSTRELPLNDENQPWPSDERKGRVFWGRYADITASCTAENDRVGWCTGTCPNNYAIDPLNTADTNVCSQHCCVRQHRDLSEPGGSFLGFGGRAVRFFSPDSSAGFDALVIEGERVTFKFKFFPEEFDDCAAAVSSLIVAKITFVHKRSKTTKEGLAVEWTHSDDELKISSITEPALFEFSTIIPAMEQRYSTDHSFGIRMTFPGCDEFDEDEFEFPLNVRNAPCAPSDGRSVVGICEPDCGALDLLDNGPALCAHLPSVAAGATAHCCEPTRNDDHDNGFREGAVALSSDSTRLITSTAASLVVLSSTMV